jgi:hypothetical protein
VLEPLGDLLSALPMFLALMLAVASIGFAFGGIGGAVAGAVAGLVLGLWLDFSNRTIAKRLRLPVSILIVALALLAVVRLLSR